MILFAFVFSEITVLEAEYFLRIIGSFTNLVVGWLFSNFVISNNRCCTFPFRDATFPILIGNQIFKLFFPILFYLKKIINNLWERSKREAINNFWFILIDLFSLALLTSTCSLEIGFHNAFLKVLKRQYPHRGRCLKILQGAKAHQTPLPIFRFFFNSQLHLCPLKLTCCITIWKIYEPTSLKGQYRHDQQGIELEWLKKMIRSYDKVILPLLLYKWVSHCVHLKLEHRFHALLKVCSNRDDTVPLITLMFQ